LRVASIHEITHSRNVDGKILQCGAKPLEHPARIEVFVIVHEPVAQTGCAGNAARKFARQNRELTEARKRTVVVGRRWMPESRDYMVIDVDHPRNRQFQYALDSRLIDPAAKKHVDAFFVDLAERIDIRRDEQELARDELPVERHRILRSTARFT
jgi:hypothetical protein